MNDEDVIDSSVPSTTKRMDGSCVQNTKRLTKFHEYTLFITALPLRGKIFLNVLCVNGAFFFLTWRRVIFDCTLACVSVSRCLFGGHSESVTTKVVVFQNVFHKQRLVRQLWLLAVFSSWSKESHQLSVGRSAAKRVYLRRLPSPLAACLPSCFSGETLFRRANTTKDTYQPQCGGEGWP